MLKNACLDAKISVDTAENELWKEYMPARVPPSDARPIERNQAALCAAKGSEHPEA